MSRTGSGASVLPACTLVVLAGIILACGGGGVPDRPAPKADKAEPGAAGGQAGGSGAAEGDPLEGLDLAERKYAEDYLRAGKRPDLPVMAVNAEQPLSSLPDGTYGVLKFTVPGAEVRQVVSDREVLASGRGDAAGRGDFWLDGINTAGLVDGAAVSLDKVPLAVAGTKRFTTVLGATKTVKRFIVLDVNRIERALRPRLEKQAGEEAARKAEGDRRRAEGEAKERAAEARRRAAVEKTEPEARAALRRALKLLDDKGTRKDGLRALGDVGRDFPGTVAAREARERRNAEVAEELALQTPDARAESYLRYARKLIGQGMTEKARERLKEIVEKFPPSSTREEARRTLKELEEDIGK